MKLLGADTIYNHADYRLMSKAALEGLSQFKEVNLFLRGIVPMIGYDTDVVTYERHERLAGESKYPLKKMLGLAFEGITSLSVKPIRFITFLGFFIMAVSIIVAILFPGAVLYGLHHPGLDQYRPVYLGCGAVSCCSPWA